jgi:hypothetical protein
MTIGLIIYVLNDHWMILSKIGKPKTEEPHRSHKTHKSRSKHYYYSMHIMKASTALGLTLLLLICNACAKPVVAQKPEVANILVEREVSYTPSEWANHQTRSMGTEATFSSEKSHPFETVDWLADCTFRLGYTLVNRNWGLRMGKNLWNLAKP